MACSAGTGLCALISYAWRVKLLRRYWGWLVLAVVLIGWFSGLAWPVLIILSLLSAIYFLLEAPVWCGAPTNDGTPCKNNSTGLLRGCWIREHKWERLKMLVSPANWRELNDGLWDSPRDRLNTLAAVATICSFAGSVIAAAG